MTPKHLKILQKTKILRRYKFLMSYCLNNNIKKKTFKELEKCAMSIVETRIVVITLITQNKIVYLFYILLVICLILE